MIKDIVKYAHEQADSRDVLDKGREGHSALVSYAGMPSLQSVTSTSPDRLEAPQTLFFCVFYGVLIK